MAPRRSTSFALLREGSPSDQAGMYVTTPSDRNYPVFCVWSKLNFSILTKYIGKTINSYETKYMQYENIFYNNSNDGYFIL
jgi:hypothetical protein